jgi:RNA recognition motif-containing protein
VGVKEWVPKVNFTPTVENPSLNKHFIKFTPPASQQQVEVDFNTYGKMSSVILMRDHVTKKQRDFGFVVFESSSVAQELLKCTNKHKINGILVHVFPSKGRDSCA